MRSDFEIKDRYYIDDLVKIMALLRGKDGCPWDKAQTHSSIRQNFIEETYEVIEAIDNDDPEAMCEELGDALLQVVFHAQMEKERERFDFDDVCDGICKKLVLRHPHIFGDENISDAEAVGDRWNEIKKASKGQKTGSETLNAVPKQLPALLRCAKLQKRAENASGYSVSKDEVMKLFDNSVSELHDVVESGKTEDYNQKVGEALFALVCLARKLSLEPEQCLTDSSDKFIDRFSKAEELLKEKEREFQNLPNDEILKIWQNAKR